MHTFILPNGSVGDSGSAYGRLEGCDHADAASSEGGENSQDSDVPRATLDPASPSHLEHSD